MNSRDSFNKPVIPLRTIICCTDSTKSCYRPHENAIIFSWQMRDNKPYYTIMYKDGERKEIPADPEGFSEAGFVINSEK